MSTTISLAIILFGTGYAKNPLAYVKTHFFNNNTRRPKNVEKTLYPQQDKMSTKRIINPIVEKAGKHRIKFLRQANGAILLSGSLIITEFARWIHDDCSDIFYRIKRLLNRLVGSNGDLTCVVEAYRKFAVNCIQPDTPVIIDLTDLAKTRAKKMKYPAHVRDGSEHKLVPGYRTNAGPRERLIRPKNFSCLWKYCVLNTNCRMNEKKIIARKFRVGSDL